MTDSVVHRLERRIREETAFHHAVDKPDAEAYARLMRELDAVRLSIQQQESERAARLLACAATIEGERARREQCRGDWS